jgi:uncharacterized membrane protein
MKKMIKKFGKLITASFIIMGTGAILFLLTPLMLYAWNMDTDVLGLIIVLIGLVIYIIGIIRSKKPGRLKLTALIILISVLSIPILSLVASLIYYLITGKPLGN